MKFLRTAVNGVAALALLASPTFAGPLHDAARAGDADLLQQLLRDGADVNEQDEAGETALFAAASGGWYSVHDQLLVAGADASIRNNDGLTVLHAAVSGGDAGVIYLLIDVEEHAKRIEIDDHDNKLGVTPVSIAAQAGRADILAYLVTYGADPEIPDKAGLTALTHAGLMGHEDVIAVLLRRGGACQDVDPAWKADCDKRRAEFGK